MTDAPKFYDIQTDEMRPVTQADIDRLMMVSCAFGIWRRALDDLQVICLAIGQGKVDVEKYSHIAEQIRAWRAELAPRKHPLPIEGA